MLLHSAVSLPLRCIAAVDSKKIRVPGASLIKLSKVKLDWMNMLWQRVEFTKALHVIPTVQYFSQLSSDSSPQKTFDYFNSIEERLLLLGTPRSQSARKSCVRRQLMHAGSLSSPRPITPTEVVIRSERVPRTERSFARQALLISL